MRTSRRRVLDEDGATSYQRNSDFYRKLGTVIMEVCSHFRGNLASYRTRKVRNETMPKDQSQHGDSIVRRQEEQMSH